MSWQRRRARPYIAAALALVAVSGCKFGSYQPSTSTTATATTPATAGIWTGTDGATGQALTAIISTDGDAVFIRADGTQFIGKILLTNSSLSAALTGFTQFGTAFADTSDSGVGTLSGTVAAANSITANLSFTTGLNTSYPSSWSLSYETLSTVASSTAAVAGSYTDPTTAASVSDPDVGATISVSSTGTMSSSGAASGCALSGSISTNNTAFNLYQVSFTYSGCTGSFAVLNAVPLSGLAVLNTHTSPAQLLMGVNGFNSVGAPFGLTFALNQ